METNGTKNRGLEVSLSELQSVSAHLCEQCRCEYQDAVQRLFDKYERDRLERTRKECADQQEAELKRREFFSGD